MTNKVFGQHDENTIIQFQDVASRALRAALMADGHVGYVMPIGGVAAYDNMVSLMGVGVDIACGNCAIKLDMKLGDIGQAKDKIDWQLNKIADEIQDKISFGMGRSNRAKDAPDDHEVFTRDAWDIIRSRAGHGMARELKDKAKIQLGTVGGGNHYVDVFHDEEYNLWVGVHFGSRGLGHNIAMGFNALAQGGVWGDRKHEAEGLLSLKSSIGQDYWECMKLAGEYAYAGREWVARTVAKIIGAKEVEMVHNHHNFAWKESHYIPQYNQRTEVVVVRKGATPAFPKQRGFVGGSMGDMSVILEGRDHVQEMWDTLNDGYDSAVDAGFANKSAKLQADALYSTVHGAGRVMSRTEAAGKRNRKTGALKLNAEGNPVKPPRVTQEMMDEWCRKAGVVRRGGEVDESPHVYRRLPDVLQEQGDTIEVTGVLKPLIVVMAGKDIFDPYKD
jgi:tRNA-splicing ligase RtcB